ncbi:hypothetical protein D3C72_2009140 [compost metagenome]
MADNSEGANSGSKVMVRSSPLNGMQLRVSAYANVKASGNTMSVTSADTQTLFQRLWRNAGDAR